jgi:hypothetical protein
MDYNKIMIGILFGLFGQIATFIQLQGSYRYGWDKAHLWIVLMFSIPIGWLYLKSVHFLIEGFGGQIWASRIIGFGIGIVVFTIMSYLMFREPLNFKNFLCICLGLTIILIQLFYK